jgi:hypothetical protein
VATVDRIAPSPRRRVRAALGEARSSLVIAALGASIGVIYVWLVQPGLPYDEPSHWSTVLYYANHAQLPVLGHSGVTYEAQQGPLAYTLDALLVTLARDLGGSLHTCFRLVRLLGLAELAATVPLIAAITRRAVCNAKAAIAATVVFALNPMLLTMSASVQNDSLALLLGVLTLYVALAWLSENPLVLRAGTVGVIAGLGVLTKLTVLPAAVAIPLWLLWRHRRRGLAAIGAFVVAVLATSGWWFIRNISLYGDPTGAAGVHRLGLSFPPYAVHGVSSVGHLAEEAVTYLWLPTEYLRNAFHAPAVLKAILIAITVAVVVLAIIRRRSLGPAAPLIAGCGLLALCYWLGASLTVQFVPPRLGYMAWPLWIAMVALAVLAWRPGSALLVALVLMAALNAWTLYEVASFSTPVRFIPAKLATTPGRVSASLANRSG